MNNLEVFLHNFSWEGIYSFTNKLLSIKFIYQANFLFLFAKVSYMQEAL